MNKTRKLTQGAMLLAIIGAVMLIDRQLSFLFEDLIILLVPVVIVIYSTMYEIKDGALFSFGLGALTILFGSTISYIYMPLSVAVGLGMSFCVKKNFDRRRLSIVAIVLFTIGEVVATFIVFPLIGIDFASQLKELGDLLNQNGLSTALQTTGINLPSFLAVVYVCTTVIVGVLEGYLTSLITTLLLRRLKVKDIGISNIMDLKISPVASYILFGVSMLSFINLSGLREKYEILTYVLMCISVMAAMVLAYYGYIFLIIYGRLTIGKKALIFIILGIILLFPLSVIALMIVGFLYGAGPLRRVIDEKIKNRNEKE